MLQMLSTTGMRPGAARNHVLLQALLFVAVASLAACRPSAPVPAPESDASKADVSEAKSGADAAAVEATPAPLPASGAVALIGKTMPPYPDALQNVEGSCVPGGSGLDHACDFGLAVLGTLVEDAPPVMRYVIASRNTDPAANQPQWQVSDALDAPKIDAGYTLQIAGCRLDGVSAAGIVAVVRHGDAEYSSDVTWARRFDTATGALGEIAVDRVDCVDPGFGL
jgi:hypothetical protein